MKPEESLRHLKAAQLMLLGKDNQPISDLYYALQDGVDAIEEKTRNQNTKTPTTESKKSDAHFILRSVKFMPYDVALECSVCGKWGNIQTFSCNFCPNCGSAMRQEVSS